MGASRHRREKALIPGFLSHGVSASHLVIFRQDTPGNESGQGTNGGPKRGPDPTDNHGIAYRQSCPRRQSPRSSPTPGVMPRTRRRGAGGRFDQGGGRPDGRFSLHPENPMPESRMHPEVPVRFGRGRLDSLGNKGLAAYLIGKLDHTRARCSRGRDSPRDRTIAHLLLRTDQACSLSPAWAAVSHYAIDPLLRSARPPRASPHRQRMR